VVGNSFLSAKVERREDSGHLSSQQRAIIHQKDREDKLRQEEAKKGTRLLKPRNLLMENVRHMAVLM
jgi:hypothetical protein